MKAPQSLTLAGHSIGPEEPPFIIAEMSGNHNGDIGRALAIVDMAADAGADAIKLQTYRADTITIDHDSEEFMIRGGLWDGRRLFELYQEAYTPWEWHEEIFDYAKQKGLIAFSSPFDHTAVDFLESINSPAYKIASFEIVDIPLIEKAAGTGKPLIISTGMASLDDIDDAVKAATNAGAGGVILLHCVSGYPTPVEQANLRAMVELKARYGTFIGLSDHSMGISVPLAAVALGATVIEKHVTLDRSAGGPDDAFSLEPDELSALCKGAREAWQAMGSSERKLKPSEDGSQKHRRSLYVVADIKKGEALTEKNIRSIRPANGLAPKHYRAVLGQRAKTDIDFGTPLSFDLIEA